MFDEIVTYSDFAKTFGDMILCNEIASRPIELIHGEIEDGDEIFQWYLVSNPSFAMEHSEELIFYDAELDLYILGVTHFGTSWDYVSAPELN